MTLKKLSFKDHPVGQSLDTLQWYSSFNFPSFLAETKAVSEGRTKTTTAPQRPPRKIVSGDWRRFP